MAAGLESGASVLLVHAGYFSACEWHWGLAGGVLVALGAPWLGAHLLMLSLEQGDLLLHLADVAGGLGHLGPLQVPLGQQLLDVLLLLLQRLLQRRGARDLAGVA